MTKILVYVRPWNARQFADLAQGIWPGAEHINFSEHPSVDSYGLSKVFYSEFRKIKSNPVPLHLTEWDLRDIIFRCRLLRAIDEKLAKNMVCAMERSIEAMLDATKPFSLLSITVDSYILHLCVLACRRRGIRFIGLVPSFVNGYFRVTELGERIHCREISGAEVEKVSDSLLQKDYKPEFLAQSPRDLRRKARRLWLRNLPKPLWFRMKRKFLADWLNYHYFSTEVVSRSYWSPRLQLYQGVKPKTCSDIPQQLRDYPLVFLPLQMSPEATIDYWSLDAKWINYEERVLQLIDEYSDCLSFMVKEHPNLLGYRKPGFYRRLISRKNCVLVSPEITSNIMLELCDGVIVCTGTVGFEAAIRGIPVYSDSEPFHLDPASVQPLDKLRHIKQRDHSLALASSTEYNKLRYLLQGLLPGRFINDGSWLSGAHNQKVVCESISDWLDGALF